jgi:hypothetical protein
MYFYFIKNDVLFYLYTGQLSRFSPFQGLFGFPNPVHSRRCGQNQPTNSQKPHADIRMVGLEAYVDLAILTAGHDVRVW